jgi:UDP-N-acetylmuramyl pentapeptide synthase
LGEQSVVENKLLGKEIAEVADMVVVVGDFARADLKAGLEEAQFDKDQIHFLSSTSHALDFVYKNAQKDAVILIENDLPDQYF